MVYERATISRMDTEGPPVAVPTRELGDLCSLAELAAIEVQDINHPLSEALRGAVAEVRTHVLTTV